MASIVNAFRSFLLMAMVAITFSHLAILGSAYNHLLSGDKLKTGENISDINYSLIMQQDCNLVFYQNNPEKAIWDTQTKDKGVGCELTLRTNGNLVIEDENQKLIGESNTNGTTGNSVLLIQRDRNVVIYSDVLWRSESQI